MEEYKDYEPIELEELTEKEQKRLNENYLCSKFGTYDKIILTKTVIKAAGLLNAYLIAILIEIKKDDEDEITFTIDEFMKESGLTQEYVEIGLQNLADNNIISLRERIDSNSSFVNVGKVNKIVCRINDEVYLRFYL